MPDNKDKDNVHDLAEKIREKNESKGKKKKAKAGDDDDLANLSAWGKQAFICDWLNGAVLDFPLPDTKFILVDSVDGSSQIYEITSDNEIKASVFDEVKKCIARAMHGIFRDLLDLTERQIDGAAKYWLSATKSTQLPDLFGWQGSDQLVVRRIPFAFGEGPTPLFDEMMSRFTNSEALMAFIGSLFYPESNMQQYVWMYGKGNDGKGTLSRFLEKILKHLYSSEQAPSFSDRFWTYGVKDARLVVFPDNNNTHFVTSGLFKAFTGGDRIRCEIKGGKVFHIASRAKFLFLSNERPDLSSGTADQRRIIYCQCSSFESGHDSDYEARLWEEGGYFLTKCLKTYEALCPRHGLIPADDKLIREITATNEEHFSAFLENNFHFNPEFKVLPAEFQFILEKTFRKRKDQIACREYMHEKGYKKKGVANPHTGITDYFYVGIKPKVYYTVTGSND